MKKKKIDLNKFTIASLSTMKTLKGGTGDGTGGIGTGGNGTDGDTQANTLVPECDTNTEPILTSNNPLNPNTCVQTSAIEVTAGCNMG